jgi:hypothetical protein
MHLLERVSPLILAVLLTSAGCAVSGEEAPDIAPPPVADDGVMFNGLMFNGLMFNGLMFNGLMFNGLSTNGQPAQPVTLSPLPLTGWTQCDQPLSSVSLTGSTLSAMRADGSRVSGADLAGVHLTGTISGGPKVTMRIDAVTVSPTDQDILLYNVSVQMPSTSAWLPLCGLDSGQPVAAVPLSGSWDQTSGTPTGGSHVADPSVFTFACNGFVLAKCVEMGYAPWRTVTECDAGGHCHDLSLSSFHQACSRLLRADYCGDGTGTTRDGTRVDLWDDFSIQTDAAPSWKLEAEWSPSGATCVDQTRWSTILASGESVQEYITQHCPSRWQAAGCGDATSTFFTANGYGVPLAGRSLVRSRVTTH